MKKIIFLLFVILNFICIGSIYANDVDGVYRQTIMNKGYTFNATGFFNAITKNDIQTIKIFLEAGMNPNVTYSGTPATMQALFFNRNEILDLLLSSGANVETKVPALWVAMKPQNLLSYSIKKGNVEAVNILIKHGVDVNKPFNKKTPLEYARKCKRNEIVDILIKNGAIK